MNTYQIIDAFKARMREHGIEPPEQIIADGRLHRFHIAGHKPGSLNGAYFLHMDGKPNGYFEDFTTGVKRKWKADVPTKHFTDAERKAFVIERQKSAEKHHSEETKRQTEAIKKAAYIWSRSTPVTHHPYLTKKGVKPHSVRCYRGSLVIPLYDEVGTLVSLQFVGDDGSKRLMKDGKLQGCWCCIGTLEPGGEILICEGWATGASLYEATEYFILIAFCAGNLLAVAKLARKFHPDSDIIICADNDAKTPGNPGLAQAEKAALAVGARLAIPPKPGDFNDYDNYLIGVRA